MARPSFALWALRARFDPRHNRCPYCQSTLHMRIQRKKFVIEARKCHYCGLIFRWPTDSEARARRFYEHEYRSGIVTDLPAPADLAALRARSFCSSPYERREYVELLTATLPPPARVLDFGASWGYISFQLQQAGYILECFEPSRARAEFGRQQLGLTFYSAWEQLNGHRQMGFDVVFTSHTLEHVYDLRQTIDQLAAAIVPGGYLVVIVPNAGGRNARELGVGWGPYIGEPHTIAFTPEWFQQNLSRHGFMVKELFSTAPSGRDLTCDGDELVCIACYHEPRR